MHPEPKTTEAKRQSRQVATRTLPPASPIRSPEHGTDMIVPFKDTGEIVETLFPIARDALVRHTGEWCLQTVNLAPEETPGWRDLNWDHDLHCPVWCYPWSNAAERIEAFLWLHKTCGTPEPLIAAQRYADSMINNRQKGICGQRDSNGGMAWYWRESNTLMTNYTMRLPTGLLALFKATGNEVYAKEALLCGEALLRMQSPTGMFHEGAIPDDLTPKQRQEAHNWVTQTKINSRIGYALYTLSALAHQTGEARWLTALDKFATAFLPEQRKDGSFPEDIGTAGGAGPSGVPKGHFHSYILYGMARTLHLLPDLASGALLHAATRLADHMVDEIAVSGSHFYGSSKESSPGEAHMWLTARAEAAAGLAWMARHTGQTRYNRASKYLVIQAAMQQAADNTPPFMRGGITEWRRTDAYIYPTIDGFTNFWALLACAALA